MSSDHGIHCVSYNCSHCLTLQNGVSEILRLAKYLETPCDEELATAIAKKCSFETFVTNFKDRETSKTLAKFSIDGSHFICRKGK